MWDCICGPPDFTWSIDGIKEKLERDLFPVESRKFKFRDYPVLARPKLAVSAEGELRVSMDVEHLSDAAPMQLIPAVVYALKDRSGNGEPRHVLRQSTYLLGSAWTYSNMYGETLVHKSRLTEGSSLYNVDDSIRVEIFVETSAAAERWYSRDGSLHVSIPGYRRLKQREEEGCVVGYDCPYMYTGQRGYRVRVSFNLTRCCRFGADVMTVSVNFLTGKFDRELSVNFPHRTTVSLYNPRHQGRYVTATVERNIGVESAYSVVVCTNEFVSELLGADDELWFLLTVNELGLPGEVEEEVRDDRVMEDDDIEDELVIGSDEDGELVIVDDEEKEVEEEKIIEVD